MNWVELFRFVTINFTFHLIKEKKENLHEQRRPPKASMRSGGNSVRRWLLSSPPHVLTLDDFPLETFSAALEKKQTKKKRSAGAQEPGPCCAAWRPQPTGLEAAEKLGLKRPRQKKKMHCTR